MKQYFIYGECTNKGVQISPNWEMWEKEFSPEVFHTKGSYRILPARILGISYPDYLLWCQSKGARLIGKSIKYSGAVFNEPNKEVLNILNERATEIFSRISMEDLNY